MKQALIIGAGISGAVSGRILAESGFHVTILEKRNHIGGNIYDYYEEDILVHKYGPHLFHTNLSEVADFLKRFSGFFPYQHRVLGEINERLVPIPFNFRSIDLLYPDSAAEHLKAVLEKSISRRPKCACHGTSPPPGFGGTESSRICFSECVLRLYEKAVGKAPGGNVFICKVTVIIGHPYWNTSHNR